MHKSTFSYTSPTYLAGNEKKSPFPFELRADDPNQWHTSLAFFYESNLKRNEKRVRRKRRQDVRVHLYYKHSVIEKKNSFINHMSITM